MATRQQLITEVRSCCGTRFGHQGRTKGTWFDCIGVNYCSAIAVGLLPADFDDSEYRGYGALPDSKRMESMLDKYLDRVPRNQELPGDLGWMSDPDWGGAPRHLFMLSAPTMIIHAHSLIGKGRVVEQTLPADWRRKVRRYYRFRGLEDYWRMAA